MEETALPVIEEEALSMAQVCEAELERLIFASDIAAIVTPKQQPQATTASGERDGSRSIGHVAQSALASLAKGATTRPQQSETWDRRRTSTAISVLVAAGLVRHLGVPPGYKRTLSLNRNLVALCTCLPKLLEMYRQLVSMRMRLENVQTAFFHEYKAACESVGQRFEMPAIEAYPAVAAAAPAETTEELAAEVALTDPAMWLATTPTPMLSPPTASLCSCDSLDEWPEVEP